MSTTSTQRVPVPPLQVWALSPHDSWILNRRRITGEEESLESGTLRLSRNSLAQAGRGELHHRLGLLSHEAELLVMCAGLDNPHGFKVRV
jgi:hypothetical protein